VYDVPIAGNFLFVRSDTFAVIRNRSGAKSTEKNESRKREREFLETQTTTR